MPIKTTILVALLLVFLGTPTYAQKIHFCDTTNRWITTGYDSVYSRPVTTYYSMSCCDTPNFSYTYFDIRVDGFDGSAHFVGDYLIREDTTTGILYWLNDMNATDEVFFDYNRHTGDVIHGHNALDTNLVDSIISVDLVLIGDYYYKVFRSVELDTSYPKAFNFGWRKVNTFVEGIGNLFAPSNRRPIYEPYTEFLTCFKNHDTVVNMNVWYSCPQQNDTLFYVNECASLPPLGTDKPPLSKGNGVDISPNPASTYITLTPATGQWQPGTIISVYDMQGRCMLHRVTDSPAEKIILDSRLWASGTYLLRVDANNLSVREKILIEK